MDVSALVDALRRRLRRGVLLEAGAAALVALALSVVVATAWWAAPGAGLVVGLVLAGALSALVVRQASARWTPLAAASYIESRVPGLDNLIVTATALANGVMDASDRMRAEVERHASARAATLHPHLLAPLNPPAWLLLLALVGAVAVVWTSLAVRDHTTGSVVTLPTAAGISMRVTITPPDYLKQPPATLDGPEEIRVPAGSRVRLEVHATTALAWREESDGRAHPLSAEGNGTFVAEWVPDATRTIAVAVGATTGVADHSRILQLTVIPDQQPRIRVLDPGRDLALGAPDREVPIVLDATDVEGIDAVRVAYVRLSGSGEAIGFDEGVVPVSVERVSGQHWRGRARLSLPSLTLEDGDALVYRALVRDTNPAGDWVSSEAFTIDIGKRLELAGAGAAIPAEDRRYALSQQMVILKTERLQAERSRLAAEAFAEQGRLLAMEQRMVRAEVVFLSGGEIQDEIVEAEHSDELQEGRLENRGRAEMLRAVAEMSRAEAQLTAGDTTRALVAERAALAALQRAFDRRRYFLRTLSERARIDPARRLTGDLAGARPSTRTAAPVADPAESTRALIRELAALAELPGPPSSGLLARLGSVDPSNPEWRQMAASLAAATSPEERRAAATAAMARLAVRSFERAGASAPIAPFSALRGWWSDESRVERRR